MSRFQTVLSDGRVLPSETLHEARMIGLREPGRVYGVEGRTGKARFYMKRGNTAYEISARVAALELAMGG